VTARLELPRLEVPRLEVRGLRSSLAGPFDLLLEPGGSLAVTGPSGAGKSVLLRMIADLDPNDGDVLLDGRSRASFTGPDWRRRVVYTAAEPGWWLEIVGEHFKTPPAELASRLGLRADIFEQPVRLCSTGERQRLALIRSLAIEPSVLLLDEPTASLDADNVARVEALLRERQDRGMALLVVTHDPAQAARLGDTHKRLEQGRLRPA
jgi:ABC-type iron transport system FetAB ATPase subunit